MAFSIVLPGQRLPASSNATPGAGVYRRDRQLYASVVGTPVQDPTTGVVSVTPHPASSSRSLVPSVDQIIIGSISKITAKWAAVEIKAIERESGPAIVLPEPFRGTIRSQDIWSDEDTRSLISSSNQQSQQSSKDGPSIVASSMIQVSLCFAPGDIVRCKVLGVGDASAGFLLSTGVEARLGVVFARSPLTGEPMVPITWNAMLCPGSGIKASRKCAKPD